MLKIIKIKHKDTDTSSRLHFQIKASVLKSLLVSGNPTVEF